jgi:DNA-binding NarL/FixJ family response regulator
VNPITVLLADDHRIVREGLLALLKQEPDIHVIGEAENGRQAVDLARTLTPAVVLMDISMPLLNGLEATRQILRATPAIRVIFLSAHDEDAYVEQAMAMGAAGYLIKLTASPLVAGMIREVCKGGPFLGPGLSKRRLRRIAKADNNPTGNAPAICALERCSIITPTTSPNSPSPP